MTRVTSRFALALAVILAAAACASEEGGLDTAQPSVEESSSYEELLKLGPGSGSGEVTISPGTGS